MNGKIAREGMDANQRKRWTDAWGYTPLSLSFLSLSLILSLSIYLSLSCLLSEGGRHSEEKGVEKLKSGQREGGEEGNRTI